MMSRRKRDAIGWTVLILGTVVIWLVGFSLLETDGLTHDDGLTLSRYLWTISMAWPPAIFIAGDLFGFLRGMLITHLWWRWDPGNLGDHRG